MSDPVARLNAALEGRYAIESELGEGGMATVYLAKDLKHERKVALKVLKPELAAVVGAERFLAEIKTTASLQHPHILALFDSGEADGFLFYVMPYVGGETLQDRLEREKQLPVDDAVRIATEVAEALEYAHGRGVIHRDIKPANILLQDGRVVVADFGIALAISAAGGARLTETGLSMGTPLYMSPEQATGDRELDGRSDLYSLACITYEMLAGDPPYAASTAQAILSRILTEDPKPLSGIRPSVPPHVEAAVHRALEKLPADRPQRAASFAEDLRTARAVPRTAGDSANRRPWMVAAALTLALLGVAGTGWILLGGGLRPTSIEQSIAVLPFDDLSAEGDQQYFVEGLSDEIINALTQIPDLKVAARTSTFILAEENASIEMVASALGVANVLEGSLRKSGDRVRITAQLIEARSGFHLWSETFDRDLTDIFEIQAAIARAIVEGMALPLGMGASENLVRVATADLDAYDLYLRARMAFANRQTLEDVDEVIRLYEQATSADPGYALAREGAAEAWAVRPNFSSEWASDLARAEEQAQAALSLDGTLTRARLVLASIHRDRWEWEEAERGYELSLASLPNDPEAHHEYGEFLLDVGRCLEAAS